MINLIRYKKSITFKGLIYTLILSLGILTCGPLPTSGYAQGALVLPPPGAMVNLSPAFTPPILRGIQVFPKKPFQFDFIVETGSLGPKNPDLESESTKLVKYFLASLTVPEEDLWVNLSPHESDRIIPEQFGITEMGRDLLAQDYILKQLTASLLFPGKEIGLKFWNTVYQKAQKQFGTTEIPFNTFHKVWIVPEKAVVYVKENTAFVAESHLKVMLEEDYLASREAKDQRLKTKETSAASSIQSAVLREIILPEIEKEINQGENFSPLRQIYHSMILATWFKRNLRQSLLGKIYVEQNKVTGVDIADKEAKEKIYQQYLEAYRSGVYNLIQEDYDSASQKMIPRKYFSGGAQMGQRTARIIQETGTATTTSQSIQSPLVHAMTEVYSVPSSLDTAMLTTVFTKRTRKNRNKDVFNLIRDPRVQQFLRDAGINLAKGRHTVVDFGLGALPFGAVEMKESLQEFNPHIRVVGIEDRANAATAHLVIPQGALLDKLKYFARQYITNSSWHDLINSITEARLVITPNGNPRDFGISEIIVKVRSPGGRGEWYLPLAASRHVNFYQDGRRILNVYKNVRFFDEFIHTALTDDFLETFLGKGLSSDVQTFKRSLTERQIKIGNDTVTFGKDDQISLQKSPVRAMMEKNNVNLELVDTQHVPKVKNAKVVTLNDVWAHLGPDQKQDVRKEITRILAEGGILIVKTESRYFDPTLRSLDVYQRKDGQLVYLGSISSNDSGTIFSGRFDFMMHQSSARVDEGYREELTNEEWKFLLGDLPVPARASRDKAILTENRQTDLYTMEGRHAKVDQVISELLRKRPTGATEKPPKTFVEIGIGGYGAPTMFEWLEDIDSLRKDGTVSEDFMLYGVENDRQAREPAQIEINELQRLRSPLAKHIKIHKGGFGNLSDIASKTDGLDVVRSLNVLLHYNDPETQEHFRQEVANALRTGGIFIEGSNGHYIFYEKTKEGTLRPIEFIYDIYHLHHAPMAKNDIHFFRNYLKTRPENTIEEISVRAIMRAFMDAIDDVPYDNEIISDTFTPDMMTRGTQDYKTFAQQLIRRLPETLAERAQYQEDHLFRVDLRGLQKEAPSDLVEISSGASDNAMFTQKPIVYPKMTAESRNTDVLRIIESRNFLGLMAERGLDLRRGEHTALDYGVGAMPFGPIELRQNLSFVNPKIQVIGTELPGLTARAHIIIPEGYLLRSFKRLADKLVTEKEYHDTKDRIFEIRLVVSDSGDPSDAGISEIVIGTRYGEGYPERYTTIATSPKVQFVSRVENVSWGTKNQELFTRFVHGILSTAKIHSILNKTQNLDDHEAIFPYDPYARKFGDPVESLQEQEGVVVQFDPLQKQMAKRNTRFVEADDLVKAGVKGVSLITANNTVIHMSRREKREFKKMIAKVLKENGVLIVKNGVTYRIGEKRYLLEMIDFYQKKKGKVAYLGSLSTGVQTGSLLNEKSFRAHLSNIASIRPSYAREAFRQKRRTYLYHGIDLDRYNPRTFASLSEPDRRPGESDWDQLQRRRRERTSKIPSKDHAMLNRHDTINQHIQSVRENNPDVVSARKARENWEIYFSRNLHYDQNQKVVRPDGVYFNPEHGILDDKLEVALENEDGEVLAYALLEEGDGFLNVIALSSEVRGKGYGAELLRQMLEHFKKPIYFMNDPRSESHNSISSDALRMLARMSLEGYVVSPIEDSFIIGNNYGDRNSSGKLFFAVRVEPDKAILTDDKDNVGGIDLNPTDLDIETRGDTLDVHLPTDVQGLEDMQIDGIVPVIFQITPVTNVPLLLGSENRNDPQKPLALLSP